jgi:hypothetical protein
MNIEHTLMKAHSKVQCDKVVRYVGNDKKRFAELMQLFFKGEYRVTQRAGWPMSYCVKNHPALIQPYFKKMLAKMHTPGVHDAVKRNIVRLLQYVDIPEKFRGEVMNTCFELIAANDTAIAIKAFSLTILQNMSKDYPEILPELKLIIEERWPHETAAFRSRAKKIIRG